MVRFPILVFASVIVSMAGCTWNPVDGGIPENASTALEKGERFELLSLDPQYEEEKPKDGFHGWRILGTTQIEDAETRKKLTAALKKGIEEHDGSVAACFVPRHGIRVTHEGKTYDFVICFQCHRISVYAGGKYERGFLTMGSPQVVFDQVLRGAGVPLPKPDSQTLAAESNALEEDEILEEIPEVDQDDLPYLDPKDNRIPANAKTALENGGPWELFSINPGFKRENLQDGFRKYEVLGTMRIDDAETRKRLLSALEKGRVEKTDASVPACFNPRHGIRVFDEDKAFDFLICFECLQVRVYADEKYEGEFLTERSPQIVFDQVLREAGVALPEPAK